MYKKTTNNICVIVEPRYLESQSRPQEGRYVWAYTITIENLGTATVQLHKRFWQIIDGRGRKMEVRGSGVVGETPVLQPGESFEYTSGCPLPTASGIMVGHYEMSDIDGEIFNVDVPSFTLESSDNPGNLH